MPISDLYRRQAELLVKTIPFVAREEIGRGERIRTSGLLVPNQALYQAEPRPELNQRFSHRNQRIWSHGEES